MKQKFSKIWQDWLKCEEGVSAMEAALIFPLLMILFLGVYDMGNAILSNQKTIKASQITADLITRHKTVSTADIDDAVEGGRLALEPLDNTNYGVDIVSIRFDENALASIIWRETVNMTPAADVLMRVASLAEANSGVVVVISQYIFEPLFAGFVIDQISMEEVAFARGRTSAVVNME